MKGAFISKNALSNQPKITDKKLVSLPILSFHDHQQQQSKL
jgi:hypothetical protein